MMSASNSDLKSNLVSSPIAYAQPAQPYVPNAPYDSSTRYPAQYTPPTGKWRDDWWNCFSNLWPSCCCVASGGQFGGCMAMFLAAQISTRVGWLHTKTIMTAYVILIALFVLISLIIVAASGDIGTAYTLLYIPTMVAFVFLIILRYKFVAKYQIQEEGILTCLIAFFCSPCSLCQMARHQYGYTRVFDGDGLVEGNMVYPPDDGVTGV